MTPDMAVQVAQLSWMEAAEQEAATGDLEALLTETRGTLEKLAEGHFKLGSWQMVLWQPRWVYAEEDAFCYQKISADERPIGRKKRIEFANVKDIVELEYGEFVLQCQKRDYTFKAASDARCQILVHNLRQLRERFKARQ